MNRNWKPKKLNLNSHSYTHSPFCFCLVVLFMSDELEVKKEYYDSGKLKKGTHYKNRERDGL